jgi:hypothetical protein
MHPVSVVWIGHLLGGVNSGNTLQVPQPDSTPRRTSGIEDYSEGEYPVSSKSALS